MHPHLRSVWNYRHKRRFGTWRHVATRVSLKYDDTTDFLFKNTTGIKRSPWLLICSWTLRNMGCYDIYSELPGPRLGVNPGSHSWDTWDVAVVCTIFAVFTAIERWALRFGEGNVAADKAKRFVTFWNRVNRLYNSRNSNLQGLQMMDDLPLIMNRMRLANFDRKPSYKFV